MRARYRRWGTREQVVLARTASANAASPEVAAMARAVAAQAPHDADLAAANSRFWAERLALDGAIVERAIARGELAPGTDPAHVIESVLGPRSTCACF